MHVIIHVQVSAHQLVRIQTVYLHVSSHVMKGACVQRVMCGVETNVFTQVNVDVITKDII